MSRRSLVGAPCNLQVVQLRFISEVSWKYAPRVFSKEFYLQ